MWRTRPAYALCLSHLGAELEAQKAQQMFAKGHCVQRIPAQGRDDKKACINAIGPCSSQRFANAFQTPRGCCAHSPLEVGVDPWPDQKRSMASTLCLTGASGTGLFID
jgi:hypothetical protein